MKKPACPELSRRARILSNTLLGLLFLHLTSSPAFAQCGSGDCTDTPIGCIPHDLPAATACLFGVFVNILAALAIIMFIAGGIQVMASGDNPEGLQEGKKKMTAAVSGFFFLLLFVVIIDMIGIRMLGISILSEVIKPWR